MVGWGSNNHGDATFPPVLTGITAIASSFYHGLAFGSDHTVTAWGDNDFGAATVPAGLMNVNAIAIGVSHSLAANLVPLLQPYTFSGFQRPLGSAPVINIGKAGSTYPVKWQLKDPAGAFFSRLSVSGR